MLLNFSFSNFLSYKDSVNISFEASKGINKTENVYSLDKKRILKGMACFGPNASGKTNIIKAVEYSRRIIYRGLNSNDSKKFYKINSDNYISSFKYQFYLNDEVYNYEIEIDTFNNIVKREKLYTPKKCGIIFDRYEIDGTYTITSNYKGIKNEDKKFYEVYVSDFMTNNDNRFNRKFFLTEVAKRAKNTEYFELYKMVLHSILNIITIYPSSEFLDFASIIRDDQDFTKFKKLLFEYGIDITDIKEIKEDFDNIYPNLTYEEKENRKNKILDELNNFASVQYHIGNGLCSFTKNDNNEIEANRLCLLHGSDDMFEFEEESNGTKRLFDLLPLLLIEDFKEDGPVILIDEIEQSLHTCLTTKFIKDLMKSNNLKKGQFLITSHDIYLLEEDIFRHDQVLLIDKDENHISRIKNLKDFGIRQNKNLVNSYFMNEFGSVPIIK